MIRKMTRASWGVLPPASPRALRDAQVKELEAFVKMTFEHHSELRSALIAFGQYWADEADDAVHAKIVFSSHGTPFWPHGCSWEDEENPGAELSPVRRGDSCTSCGDLGWPPFDDNGDGIIAFQSCCHEEGSQESTTAEAYVPYAMMRRDEGGIPRTEILGGPVRAWLDDLPTRVGSASAKRDPETEALFDLVYAHVDDDAPRAVLADHLLQSGDPLGEYVSLALSPRAAEREAIVDRMRELERAHAGRWLGPLADVTPTEYAELSRGFLRRVAVHLASDEIAEHVMTAREWGTVEDLWFLPQSLQRLSPAMRSLRCVGPITEEGLDQLAATPSLECVVVIAEHASTLDRLAALALPRLRRLGVGSVPGGLGAPTEEPIDGRRRAEHAELVPSLLAPLTRASFWRNLEELIVLSIDPSVIRTWVERSPESRPKVLTFVAPSPIYRPAGFRLRVAGTTATIDMPEIGARTSFAELGAMVEALPSSIEQLVFAETGCFRPTDAEIGALATVARRPTGRA